MTALKYLRQGAVAPETVSLIIASGASGVDLTTVTGATFAVMSPARSLTWATAISGATASQLTLTHTLAPDDTNDLGPYMLRAALTVPGGTIHSEPVSFAVLKPFQQPPT